MRRRAYVRSMALTAALVPALAAGPVGCSGGSDGGRGGPGGGGGSSSTAKAEPGTFETLPEPCGTVEEDSLRDLLPLAEGQRGSGTPQAYQGEASVTYDTDRRVGCRWKSSTSSGSHHLHVDFERVVSYDDTVSDDDRAGDLYAERAVAAGVPSPAVSPPTSKEATRRFSELPEPSSSATASPGSGGGDDQARTGDAPGDASSTTTAAPDSDQDGASSPDSTDSPATQAPRALEDIGDAAFLDDVLYNTGSGVHRDVTLVFRAANVVVTVEYSRWVTDKRQIPDSAELQQKAERLAKQLASAFQS